MNAALKRGDTQAPLDWEELIDAFLEDRKRRRCRASTLETYRHQIGSVAKVLMSKDPLALTADDAETYVASLEAAGRSAATIVRGIDAVNIVQRWCVEKGWLRSATWDDVQRPDIVGARHHLRPDQVGAFLRAAAKLSRQPPPGARDADWRTWEAAAWLLLHGMRVGELAHLRIGDIDLENAIVFVWDRSSGRTKTRSSQRAFYITSEHGRACLVETFQGRPSDEHVFDVTRGEGSRGRDKTKWFGRRCLTTCLEAGIHPPVTPHGLRHSTATGAVVAGAEIASLQAFLGHSSPKVTTNTYTHVAAAQRSQGAANAIGGWLDRSFGVAPRTPGRG